MSRIICLFLLTGLCACAGRPAPQHFEGVPIEPPVSDTPDAQAIYSYLASWAYARDQKPEAAAQAMEKAISLAPSPELYAELGHLYWRNSRFPDAIRVLRQGLDAYPDSHSLLGLLAKTYAAQKRFDDAVLTLDEYLAGNPRVPQRLDILHEAAAYRMEQRRFDDAADRLSAIPKDQATAVTHFLLGKALAGLGLLDRAVAHLRRAVTAEPGYFDAWVELGLTHEARKNYIEAERAFSHLLESGSDNPQIVLKVADINLKLNDPDRALAVVRQYPEDLDLILEAAGLFISQGFPEHAAQILEPLASQDPIPADALFQLALLEYEGRENPAKALAYLEAIPATHPHYERGLLFRVHLLFQTGREQDARTLCREAIGKFPGQPDFPLLLAELDERAGDTQAALETLLKAAGTWPKDTAVLYRLGLLHDRMGHRDLAFAVMEKVIMADPEHADALNFLGYTLADEGRDLERAETLIENALRIKPDNGYYIDSLAWVYFRQGEIRRAWQEIRRAVRFVETDPVIWEHYGDIAAALGLPGEAHKGYSRALNLEGDNAPGVRTKLDGLDKK